MKRFCAAMSFVCLALMLASEAQAQKAKKPKTDAPAGDANTTDAGADDYKRLMSLKELTGELVTADAMSLVLRIDVPGTGTATAANPATGVAPGTGATNPN